MQVANSRKIFLVNDHVRAIQVEYEPGDGQQFDQRPASTPLAEIPMNQNSYDLCKTMDQNLKVGDYCVVQSSTRHGITISRVIAIDVDVDFTDTHVIRWAFGRIATEDCLAVLSQEREVLEKIASAERRRERDKLKEALMKDNPELFSALAAPESEAPDSVAPDDTFDSASDPQELVDKY